MPVEGDITVLLLQTCFYLGPLYVHVLYIRAPVKQGRSHGVWWSAYMQVAQFSAELERYQPAIAIYEDVARTSMDNNLLKYSAKGYLLCAGICRLCGAAPCDL